MKKILVVLWLYVSGIVSISAADTTKVIIPDYTFGLGDNLNTVHWAWIYKNIAQTGDSIVNTSWSQALEMTRQMYNVTNGTNQVNYGACWSQYGFNEAPEFTDCPQPYGDSTNGTAFGNHKRFVREEYQYNAETGGFLDDTHSGPKNIPQNKHKSLDSTGVWKKLWVDSGSTWYALSICNKWADGSQQALLTGYVNNWGMSHSVFEDAFVLSGRICNQSTALGGAITTPKDEDNTAIKEMSYLWHKFAIGTFVEFSSVKAYDGYAWGYWGGVIEDPSNEECRSRFSNARIFMHRTMQDMAKDLAWGSEWGPRSISGRQRNNYYVWNWQNVPDSTFMWPISELRRIFYKHTVQYLYMQRFVPDSYIENANILQVTFKNKALSANNLVSIYNKLTTDYKLTLGDVVLATGTEHAYDRFVPQVGAGLKIFAYSYAGSNRAWTLPATWKGVVSIDVYSLSMTEKPVYVNTLLVSNNQVTLKMNTDQPYILIPAGNSPTPVKVMFNDINVDSMLSTYKNIVWDIKGIPILKVQGPNTAGGFTSNHCYINSPSTSTSIQIKLPSTSIMHSLRVGNKGGSGSVILHSSNTKNHDVVFTLPLAGKIALMETDWTYSENDNITITVSNSLGVKNTLFDNFAYSIEGLLKTNTQ